MNEGKKSTQNRTEPFSVKSILCWVPFWVQSIRGWAPFGVESILCWVPFWVQSSRGWVHLGFIHSGLLFRITVEAAESR